MILHHLQSCYPVMEDAVKPFFREKEPGSVQVGCHAHGRIVVHLEGPFTPPRPSASQAGSSPSGEEGEMRGKIQCVSVSLPPLSPRWHKGRGGCVNRPTRFSRSARRGPAVSL